MRAEDEENGDENDMRSLESLGMAWKSGVIVTSVSNV